MSGGDLAAALMPVVESLQRLGVRYYVTGSVASSAHGVARASLDVDLVAELAVPQVDQLADLLEADYYTPRRHMRAAATERRSFNLIHLRTMFKIDVFVSKDRPFDREAASRARAQVIDHSPEAPRIIVASAEDTEGLRGATAVRGLAPHRVGAFVADARAVGRPHGVGGLPCGR